MFPTGYLPLLRSVQPSNDTMARSNRTDGGNSSSSAKQAAASPSSPSQQRSSVRHFSSTATLHNRQQHQQHHRNAGRYVYAANNRVDTMFALPPALITCLVRHVDSHGNLLATPAIVERCLRDLQRRLMPWIPAERLFGSTMPAFIPAGMCPDQPTRGSASNASAAHTLPTRSPSTTGAAISGGSLTSLPLTSVPHAGSYLKGSHVRLQLAKTTDSSAVAAVGASVLHLLLYAVDEPESKPSHLAHIVQQWSEALKAKGEEHDCMVLLVHRDLVAAAEAASRMAEEAQAVAATSQKDTPPPASVAPTVSQDKVDAASAQLHKYYKELQDLKFSRQQVSAYMPNETPMRILERLRPAVIARGGRLRQALQQVVSRKRQYPQDPSTKPVSLSSLSAPSPLPVTQASSAAAAAGGAATPKRTSAGSTATHRLDPAAGATALPSTSPSHGTPSARAQYFNIQALWCTGYDLIVHYLQYGLVFDAREALEHLYLEYYNNSDDYIFLRAPVATLERLGRVPNLFDAHGHAGWETGKTGYPKALEPGAELLEGLLLLASAEMACSMLLGEAGAALTRYHTFMQVAHEKFEEWSAADATLAKTATPRQQLQKQPGEPSPLTSATYQQFFLLQCYLSGLRTWWPTSGLCRPRKPILSRESPDTAAPDTMKEPDSKSNAAAAPEALRANPRDVRKEEKNVNAPPGTSKFSPLALPPLKSTPPPIAMVLAEENRASAETGTDETVGIALVNSPLLIPAVNSAVNSGAPGSVAASAASFAQSLAAAAAAEKADNVPSLPNTSGKPDEAAAITLDDTSAVLDAATGSGGVRYSMTNPSFATSSGQSFYGTNPFLATRSFASGDEHGAAAVAAAAVATSAAAAAGMGQSATSPLSGAGARPDAARGAGASPIHVDGDHEDVEDADELAVEEEERAALANFELSYLITGSEDTTQVSAAYLIDLATSIGLLTAGMEAEELSATPDAMREAVEAGDFGLLRELQQGHSQLRRNCAEVASLLEHARDSLAAVAHDLGYVFFCSPIETTKPTLVATTTRTAAATPSTAAAAAEGTSAYTTRNANNNCSASSGTVVTNSTFANVAELWSSEQALRLWRILAAMAALALHVGDQRRREFHLYARLAVTFLTDHPNVTANIVANRLLPYVKTQGWREIELFVRRLYVEARERLLKKVGLFHGSPPPPEANHGRGSNASAPVFDAQARQRQRQSRRWLRVFHTGPAYALYRECILVLISSGIDREEGDETLVEQSTQPSQQESQQEQPNATASLAVVAPLAAQATSGNVTEEDAIGALDPRLFSARTNAQWWSELLSIDALVMAALYDGVDPPEYPLNHFISQLSVKVEKDDDEASTNASETAAAAVAGKQSGNKDSNDGIVPAGQKGSTASGTLQADVDETVRLSFAMSCAVNPLMSADAPPAEPPLPIHQAPEQQQARVQLTLESRKDWNDDDEPAHVVHIHDCEEAAYDAKARVLNAVFLFPVCHAGTYRVRRIRLCNGKTWLAYYPQHIDEESSRTSLYGSDVGSTLFGSGHRRFSSSLFTCGGKQRVGEVDGATAARADPSFQMLTRAPVLRVPEPRSSVHLRLTLPAEAHCFADSVDYVTLDVDLEEPLCLTVSQAASTTAGGGGGSGGASSSPSHMGRGSGVLNGGDNDAHSFDPTTPTKSEERASHAEEEEEETARCTCSYEASPGNLILPLNTSAEDASSSRSRLHHHHRYSHGPGASVGNDTIALGSSQQQRLALLSPGYRALLPFLGSDGAVASPEHSMSGNGGTAADVARQRGSQLLAAVVLGTPSVYRSKSVLAAATGAGGAAAPAGSVPQHGNPNASFSHTFGASRAGVAGLGGTLSAHGSNGLSNSFLFRRQLSLPQPQRTNPSTPADSQPRSSAGDGGSHSIVSLPIAAGDPLPTRPASGNLRYKSVFKSLQIGTPAPAASVSTAEPASQTDSGILSPLHQQEPSPPQQPTASGPRPGRRSSLSHTHAHSHPHVHSQHHHQHHHHSHPRSPATSERSAQYGFGTGEDGFGRLTGPSFCGAAYVVSKGAGVGVSRAAAAAATPIGGLSLLQDLSAETFELVLVHPPKQGKDGDVKNSSSSNTASPSGGAHAASTRGSAAAASLLARTIVPVHVRAFLNSIPTPDVQMKPNSACMSADFKSGEIVATTLGHQLLQAESNVSADPLRESVIRLLPSTAVTQAATAITGSTLKTTGSDTAVSATPTRIPITHMRLHLPLLPLLVTPGPPAATRTISNDTAAEDANATTATGEGNAQPTAATSPAPSASSSSVAAAKQARITFTCMRGREPSSTVLSTAIPFQPAVSLDYAFKHFQGRVYCRVRMTNILKFTSLWLRGAVLRVLDSEPSYEIVRVCDVYNQLLVTEWKPQEELSILYELDLIASFHPVQPECAHQVQMQVFYSSWEKSFLTTPIENRLVLRTVQLPPTEATAESVELIHSDATLPALSSPDRGAAAVAGSSKNRLALTRETSAPLASPPPQAEESPDEDGLKNGDAELLPSSSRTNTIMPVPLAAAPSSPLKSTKTNVVAFLGRSTASPTSMSALSDPSGESRTQSVTNVACSTRSATSSSSSANDEEKEEDADQSGSGSTSERQSASLSSASSSIANSGVVHFNVVTLRHLEETCNAILGPVATFHSKHLCVFSIVMYAESPWTMRFGAATNYMAQPPTTPLSGATFGVQGNGGGAGPLPRSSVSAANGNHALADSASPSSTSIGGRSFWANVGVGEMPPHVNSFFGNAMVDQPSDFIFVAGEPVRFCVRLQPLAQNWPEDANMEETFFIRLKYNPAEWMVIGKQRDRRTLSLMEEVTVYFNAVPLLPRASTESTADDEDSLPHTPAGEKSSRLIRHDVDGDNDEETDENGEGSGAADGSGSNVRSKSARPLAGHAVKDEGILQTPTVEMFWERKKPENRTASTSAGADGHPLLSLTSTDGLGDRRGFATTTSTASSGGTAAGANATAAPSTHMDAVMGEPVLIDVVQFRTWVRVRKPGF